MRSTLIHVLLVLLASRVEGTKDLQGGTAQKSNEDSNDQIERFLMEDDKNWDRSRHCDWLMVTPNPQLTAKGELIMRQYCIGLNSLWRYYTKLICPF